MLSLWPLWMACRLTSDPDALVAVTGAVDVAEDALLYDAPVQVSMFEVDLDSPGFLDRDLSPVLSEDLGLAAAGDSLEFSMPVTEAWFTEQAAKSASVSPAWTLGVWQDIDQDGVASDSDLYIASSPGRYLIWLDALSGAQRALGAAVGLNEVTFDLGDHAVVDMDGLGSSLVEWPFLADLSMTGREELKLVVSLGSLPARAPSLNLVPLLADGTIGAGPEAEPALALVELEETTGTQFAAARDVFGLDGLEVYEAQPVEGAQVAEVAFAGLAFADVDGDGRWAGLDGSELILASSLGVSGEDSMLVVFRRPTGLAASGGDGEVGGFGWSLLRVAEDEQMEAPWEDGLLID